MEKLIEVEVRLFATLRNLLPRECRGVQTMEIPENTSIDAFLDKLGKIEKNSLILMINGRREKDFHRILRKGDRIALFPPVGGG